MAFLCKNRVKPVGVDSGESLGWFYLWVALKNAFAVLVDIPSDVYSEHLAVKTVHESKDSSVFFSLRLVEMEG